jgi:hypothetical protein
MALIPWPTGIALKNISWQQTAPEVVNRSEFTGATRIIELGPPARWTAKGQLPPLKLAQATQWRGFVGALRGRANTFRLPAIETMQKRPNGAATATLATVSGAGQTGFTLTITGLIASVTALAAGSLITVTLASDEQLLLLGADLVADVTGTGTASLSTPLRSSPAAGAAVEMAQPWALMRAIDPIAWSADAGPLYAYQISAEEAF